jgi:hypothetical protein
VARSLADDLRGRSDADLATLLAARPDLTRPRPADVTSLAARAATGASLTRAVDGLDAGALAVLEALVVAGDPVELDWAAELLGLTPEALEAPLTGLWGRGLLWRGEDGLHVPRAAAEALGPYVAGLAPAGPTAAPVSPAPGPTAPTAAPATPAPSPPTGPRWPRAAQALATASEEHRTIVERLAWGPPVGTVGSAAWGERLEPLLVAGLLQRRGPGEVILPRAAALALRGGRLHRAVELEPPPVPVRAVPTERVDAGAGAAAADLLAMIDELAALWGPEPPRVLRAGGLAVADLRATAQALDLELPHAAFVIEAAYAAGLIDDDGELDPVWAPTAAYDDWQQSEAPRRWLELAQAWLATTRAPALVGQRRDPKASAINALSEGAATAWGRAVRHDVLALLADVAPGSAPDEAAILDRLRWARPRRASEVLGDLARAALAEAAWLGLTGYGALGSAGRALVTGAADDDVEAALTLPLPVEHVLLAGRSDRRRAGPARGPAGDVPAVGRGRRVPRRRDRVPVHAGQPATSARRRLGCPTAARRAGGGPAARAFPSRCRTWSATSPGGTAACGWGPRRRTCAATTTSPSTTWSSGAILAAYRLRRLAPGVAVAPVAPNVLLNALRDAGLLPVAEGPEWGHGAPGGDAPPGPDAAGPHTQPGMPRHVGASWRPRPGGRGGRDRGDGRRAARG